MKIKKHKIIPFARWVKINNPTEEQKEMYLKLVKEFKNNNKS